jgi:hypothetical protein
MSLYIFSNISAGLIISKLKLQEHVMFTLEINVITRGRCVCLR